MPQWKRRDAAQRKTFTIALPTVALLSLAMPGQALASGFSTARFGGEHGHPITTNPTAIYYNPAGIAESEGIHIFLDGNLALRSASYLHERGATDLDEPPDAQGANYGEATLFNAAVAPMLGATFKVGDLGIGLGFYVPFGGVASWGKNEAFEGHRLPGPVDGVQRWFAVEGTIRSAYLTLAAGYHIPAARLSLGVSGNLIFSTIDTIRARNTDGSNFLATEGRSHLNVSGLAASFGAGAMFEAMPDKLWLGASYQSRPNVAGGMTLEGTLRNKFGTGAPSEEDIKVTQDLPDIIRLGARLKVRDDLELRLFGDYSRWSALKDQCISAPDVDCAVNEDGSPAEGSTVTQNIPRRWQDAFGVRAGLSYWPEPWAEVFSGVGYDGNAVPDATLEPGLTDFHDISVAIGGRFQVVEQLHIALSYTHIFYVQRDNSGKSEVSQFQSPSIVPDAGGIYNQTIGVVNANVEVSF